MRMQTAPTVISPRILWCTCVFRWPHRLGRGMDIIVESHECLVPGITAELRRGYAVVGHVGALRLIASIRRYIAPMV